VEALLQGPRDSPAVEPVLVVRVEDGTQTELTRTDLSKAVDVLEKVYGRFAKESWPTASSRKTILLRVGTKSQDRRVKIQVTPQCE
jgi:hypothetical protein